MLKKQNQQTVNALETYGTSKVNIYLNSVRAGLQVLDQVNAVKPPELDELRNDVKSLIDSVGTHKTDWAYEVVGVQAGIGVGGLLAFGAYNGAVAFGTAGTGTAISTLGGAAASNAALAWLGGGTLAAGGFGIMGGMALLGGVVTVPAVIGIGISKRMKTKKKFENLQQIEDLANYANDCLLDAEQDFNQAIADLQAVIESSGTHSSKYSSLERQVLGEAVRTALQLRRIMAVNLVDQENKVIAQAWNQLQQ